MEGRKHEQLQTRGRGRPGREDGELFQRVIKESSKQPRSFYGKESMNQVQRQAAATLLKSTEDKVIPESDYLFAIKEQTVNGIPISPRKTSQPPREHFEEKLREMRLQNTMKLRKELEQKLKHLDQDIDLLASQRNEDLKNGTIKKPKEHTWLTTDARQKWQEEWNQKAKEAEEFTKKVKMVQKEIHKREKEKQRLLAEKAAKENEEKKRIEEEMKIQLMAQKEEEKRLREQKIEQERKQREFLLSLAKSKITKKDYAHEKLLQRYATEVEMPELEKRKQEIAEKRNLYRPIRKPDLEDHKKRYEEIAMKLEEDRRKARELRTMGNPEYQEKAKELRTVFTEEFIKKRQEERDQFEKWTKQQKEKQEKRLAYAKVIKETFAPEKDEAKAAELEEKIKKIKHPVRQPPPAKPRLTPKAKERLLNKAKKANRSERKSWTEGEGKGKRGSSNEPAKGSKVSMGVQAETTVKPSENKKIDYLKDVKKMIHKRELPIEVKKGDYFETVANNTELSPKEKYQKVKSQLELLEGNARKKENMLVKGGASGNIQLGAEVSDMYINAIKAKITLLGLQYIPPSTACINVQPIYKSIVNPGFFCKIYTQACQALLPMYKVMSSSSFFQSITTSFCKSFHYTSRQFINIVYMLPEDPMLWRVVT
eukprot:TRINITY_DN135071_c1_g1_i1.p2 TRINITY_DN135071_c1_g1~~TRINITY_DN135071_c1_g1_i1.p2  ORF type:complete len:653 (-),score=97.15 TRINITY_DN135071_c1_g1_i1:678-2636(-)